MLNAASFKPLPCLLCFVPLLARPASAHAQSAYTITDLGTLGGGMSFGCAISNSGQITGYSLLVGNTVSHAFLYDSTGLHDLGTLGGGTSYGYAINNGGQIAGAAQTAGNAATHAVRWSSGSAADLGTAGGSGSEGHAINSSGQVVGFSLAEGDTAQHAVLWTGTTGKDLGTLGGIDSDCTGINDSGQMTGWSATAGRNFVHAFRMTGTTMTDLGTLGGQESYGEAINNAGQIAGESNPSGNAVFHAALWTGTTVQDLGTLGGYESYGYAINLYGDVVGYSTLVNGTSHAFLFLGGRMKDLNALLPTGSGWTLTDANGINDKGWITGQGRINGQLHAYVLRPTGGVVTGRIALEGVPFLSGASPAAPLGTFHISLRAPGTTTELYGRDVTLAAGSGSAFGAYTFDGIPNSRYDIAIKGGKSLRVLLPGVTVNGRTVLPDVTLPGGDANNDNTVDIGDFGVLVNAYHGDASIADSGYDVHADFNYDGVVDIGDFGILVNNYDQSGAL